MSFYEHVDTRISSLGYIKLKRLDNDIKQKAFQKLYKLWNQRKTKKKVPHRDFKPACMRKDRVHGVKQSNV